MISGNSSSTFSVNSTEAQDLSKLSKFQQGDTRTVEFEFKDESSNAVSSRTYEVTKGTDGNLKLNRVDGLLRKFLNLFAPSYRSNDTINITKSLNEFVKSNGNGTNAEKAVSGFHSPQTSHHSMAGAKLQHQTAVQQMAHTIESATVSKDQFAKLVTEIVNKTNMHATEITNIINFDNGHVKFDGFEKQTSEGYSSRFIQGRLYPAMKALGFVNA